MVVAIAGFLVPKHHGSFAFVNLFTLDAVAALLSKVVNQFVSSRQYDLTIHNDAVGRIKYPGPVHFDDSAVIDEITVL